MVSAAKTSSAGRRFSGGKKNLLAIYSKGLCHKSFLQFVSVLDFDSVSSLPMTAMYLLDLSYLLIN